MTKPTMTLTNLTDRFSTEEACNNTSPKALAEWCAMSSLQNKKVYELKTKPFHWVCKAKECGGRNGYRFSVITKTVFENTNYPLRTWFQVIYLMTQSKKGHQRLADPSPDRKRGLPNGLVYVPSHSRCDERRTF